MPARGFGRRHLVFGRSRNSKPFWALAPTKGPETPEKLPRHGGSFSFFIGGLLVVGCELLFLSGEPIRLRSNFRPTTYDPPPTTNNPRILAFPALFARIDVEIE